MIVKLEFLIEVFFSEIIVLEIINKLRNAELYCSVSDRILLQLLQMLVSINIKRLIIRYVVVVVIRSV